MTVIQVGKHYKNAILGSARKAPGGIYHTSIVRTHHRPRSFPMTL